MQLELFGNITSRRYWVHKNREAAILGTVEDLKAWCYMKSHRYTFTAFDFSLVACTENDIKDIPLKVSFQLAEEIYHHPITVNVGYGTPKNGLHKLAKSPVFEDMEM